VRIYTYHRSAAAGFNILQSTFLESGIDQYSISDDVINFGLGANSQNWAQMRKILSKQNGNSIYITGFTPFKK